MYVYIFCDLHVQNMFYCLIQSLKMESESYMYVKKMQVQYLL